MRIERLKRNLKKKLPSQDLMLYNTFSLLYTDSFQDGDLVLKTNKYNCMLLRKSESLSNFLIPFFFLEHERNKIVNEKYYFLVFLDGKR